MREIIEVEPRIKEYVPYAYWLLGTSIRGAASKIPITPEQRLAVAWMAMMRRCYDDTATSHTYYGAKGVSVCKRWHRVTAFIEDVQLLHGWENKLVAWEGHALDKDYYSSNQYGPDTCVWLSQEENNLLVGSPLVVTSPTGIETVYLTIKLAAEALGVHDHTVGVAAKGCGYIKNVLFANYRFSLAKPLAPLRYKL